MKKFIIALIATLGLASPAFADSFGVRLGYPLGVQYTMDNNLFGAGTGLRVAATLPYSFNAVGLQVDAILGKIPISSVQGLNAFYGAGLHGEFGFASTFGIGAQVTGGLEYGLTNQISIGVDASGGITYWFGAGILPYYGGALFVNFKI